ncbi:MAG: hypothetical protein ACOCRO_04530 [Halanaerobiales bacterium]
MFLNLLNMKEQELFLELAYYVAKSDTIFAEEERILIETFRQEVSLGESDYEIKDLNLNQILDGLSQIDSKKQKVIFMEIMALVMSDEEFNKKEQEIIAILKTKWNISDNLYNRIINWINDLQTLYSKANGILNE